MTKKLLVLATAAGMLFGTQTATADMSKRSMGRTVGVTCMGCHGPMGVSKGAAPSLKGLPAAHIASQMRAFKSGARPATIMNRIAKGYTDAQFDAVASFFANMK